MEVGGEQVRLDISGPNTYFAENVAVQTEVNRTWNELLRSMGKNVCSFLTQ